MRGKFIKISLTALGILLILIALILLALTSSPGENFLKAQLIKRLQDATGKKIEIASLATNIVSGIELRNITISDTVNSGSPPILRLRDLNVSYDLLKLLSRELLINSVEIDSIDFDIERDSSGNLNIINLKKQTPRPPSKSPSTFKIVVASVKIENLYGSYTDKLLNLDSHISGLTLTARLIGHHEYAFRLAVDSIESDYDSLQLSAALIKAEGDYAGRSLKLDNFSLSSSGLNLLLSGIIPLDADSGILADIHVDGTVGGLWDKIRARYNLPATINPDSISLEANVAGTRNSPDIQANLKLPSLEIEKVQARDLMITASFHDDTLSLDSLSALVFDGVIAGHGRVELNSLKQIRAELSVHDINMSKMLGLIYGGPPVYRATLNGDLFLNGDLDSLSGWNINAHFASSEAQYDSRPVPDFYVDISLADGIGHVDIHQTKFKITADATFSDRHIDGSFSAAIADLGPLAGLLNIAGLAGSIQASGTVAGPFDSLTVNASGQGKNIVYENFPIDTLAAQISYAGNPLDINQLIFAGAIDSIAAASPPFDLQSLSGKYTYNGQVSGSIDSLSGRMEFIAVKPSYQTYQADSARLNIDLRNGQIELADGLIYKNPIELKLNGRYNIAPQTGSLAVDIIAADSKDFRAEKNGQSSALGTVTADFNLSNPGDYAVSLTGQKVNLQIEQYLFPDTSAMAGWVDFDGQFRGNVNSPAINLTATIISPEYHQARFDSLYAVASFKNDSLKIDSLNIYAENKTLTISSYIGVQKNSVDSYVIDGSSAIGGYARTNDFNLSSLQSFLVSGSEIYGRSAFDITWNGTLASPGLTGQLQVDSARAILYPGAQPIDSIKIKASLADSILTIDQADGFILDRTLSVTGTAIATPWTRIDLDLTCKLGEIGTVIGKGHLSSDSLAFQARVEQMNLAVLQPFIEAVRDIGGTLNSQLTISGKPNNPEIVGGLTLDSLTFKPAYLDNKFSRGTVKISFDHQNIRLDSLYIYSDSGSVTASGSVIYTQGQMSAIDLNAAINKLTLSKEKVFSLFLKSGNLGYKSKNDRYLLDGDLYLGNFHFIQDFKFESLLPWAQSVETLRPQLPLFLEQTDFNVRLHETDSIWIDNNLAHIQLNAAVSLIGNPLRPNLTGQVSVTKGYFLYLDRKFNILRGTLLFADPNQFNPDINIQSQTQVTTYQGLAGTTYTITFDISGSLDKRKLALSSDPPLSQPDIIALLSLGATREQLTGKSGGEGELTPQELLWQRAGVLTAKELSNYLSRNFSSALGLESVSVQANLFQFNKNWGPALVISKKLSPRLDLTFNTTVGRLNNQSVTLIYMLTRRISLQGQTDRQGQANIDLNYGLKFR